MIEEVTGDQEKRKRMSAGLYISCPPQIKGSLTTAFEFGYQFIITQITHPNFTRDLKNKPLVIGRTDRVLKGSEWSRLIVAELSKVEVDSEVCYTANKSKALFLQELSFASHLSVPAVLMHLTRPKNTQLARLLNEKFVTGFNYGVWISLPMVHPSRYSSLADIEYDTWDIWNDFRTYCNYDKRLGVVLELPDIKHLPSSYELDRWIGEPVKALIVYTSYFMTNQHGKPVLSKAHQEIIKRFMSLDVQYIVKSNDEREGSLFARYLHFLGKKLYVADPTTEFVQGCEDFLQNPLQPLTEHLESNIYEVFEKDQIKYDAYQNAIYKAVEEFPENDVPVIMVVGAGRGPLVQAVMNVSYTLNRKIKIYAVEKNPYAINTLIDRVNNEWNNKVILINEDMRTYEPPEKADIIVSELLGSFGDNELSPECLYGAQRFLKDGGISIPKSYTSYLAPLQSIKIFNEIKANRLPDKSLQCCYETPYVVHLANYYQIAGPEDLFTFEHPDWSDLISTQKYRRLKFNCSQSCVLTGFVGYFDTVLYKDVVLSIHPETHTPDMVSWFPIVFPLQEPVHLKHGDLIVVSFWRTESSDKVWYEWCLESPVRTTIMNPGGRSYSIKKH